MLDIGQKDEIGCRYNEFHSESLSEFMQEKRVSGTEIRDCGVGRDSCSVVSKWGQSLLSSKFIVLSDRDSLT